MLLSSWNSVACEKILTQNVLFGSLICVQVPVYLFLFVPTKQVQLHFATDMIIHSNT